MFCTFLSTDRLNWIFCPLMWVALLLGSHIWTFWAAPDRTISLLLHLLTKLSHSTIESRKIHYQMWLSQIVTKITHIYFKINNPFLNKKTDANLRIFHNFIFSTKFKKLSWHLVEAEGDSRWIRRYWSMRLVQVKQRLHTINTELLEHEEYMSTWCSCDEHCSSGSLDD